MAQPTDFPVAALVALLLALATTAGCAGQTPDPPSLMARPIERASLEEPVPTPIVYAPLPASALARAETLVARVGAAVAASRRIMPTGRVSAPRGSDAWIEAATKASAAQAALIAADGALADIDRLMADTAGAHQATGALAGLRDTAARQVDGQHARLDSVTPR